MTKEQAKQEMSSISSGTLSTLTGIKNYDDLDKKLLHIFEQINNTDVSDCENWKQVWNKLCSITTLQGSKNVGYEIILVGKKAVIAKKTQSVNQYVAWNFQQMDKESFNTAFNTCIEKYGNIYQEVTMYA